VHEGLLEQACQCRRVGGRAVARQQAGLEHAVAQQERERGKGEPDEKRAGDVMFGQISWHWDTLSLQNQHTPKRRAKCCKLAPQPARKGLKWRIKCAPSE